MRRRRFLAVSAGAGALAQSGGLQAQNAAKPEEILPGVWRFRFGTPERITPVSTRKYAPDAVGLRALPAVKSCPVNVVGRFARGGVQLSIPLAANELVYGLGLMLQSFLQRGLKKMLRVNADPAMDSGDSHAPVPFYVTTRGYGVLVDTARYLTIYAGNKPKKGASRAAVAESNDVVNGLPAAYGRFRMGEPSEVLMEVPRASGVDVYVFAGPAMREAVQRYNLFSGGGALPPRWGLGVWYRVKGDFDQQETVQLAKEFRDRNMPCDVIGLEPGWQTHAYSCSYVWSKKFPDPGAMVKTLAAQNFRVNLWEHAFVHPTSPIHEPLKPHSGDYEVWDGLVPDFLDAEARRIFADFHRQEHVALGVSGYKLDECDNSDFTRNWSFPEIAAFPSGADGEQMHCLFGLRYQDTIQSIFEQAGKPTYGLCRSSGALAARSPYVLYSDLYDHRQFVRGMANMGFSGLLWTPELRDARDTEDLVRRLQSVALSPMALINAWYIKMPPWKQVDREANNRGEAAPDWEKVEAICRGVLELRMRLVPYLHAAFVHYRREGLPPFRALIMDYPADPGAAVVDDQYMMGESLMIAPMFAGQKSRPVYLPKGDWFDYWTGERLAGGRKLDVAAPLDRIPLYVKSGGLLPLATPTPHVEDPRGFELTVHAYGPNPAATTLYDAAGATPVRLTWQTITGSTYTVRDWLRFG